MYATRSQSIRQGAGDENARIAGKKVVAKAAPSLRQDGPPPRRALGDIGNLVGANNTLSTRSTRYIRQDPLAAKRGNKPLDIKVVTTKENIKALPPRIPVKKPVVKSTTLTAQLTSAADPLPSIDEADRGNQLAVVDYVEDIYSFYRKTEGKYVAPPDYMSRHTDINCKMRAILVDWLVEAHRKFNLQPETLFLTINILDRYLSMNLNVFRSNLQLIGVTAFLIAAKYEEIWAPTVKDIAYICDNAYTGDDIRFMEKKILNTLGFNLTVPTPYVFLIRYFKAAKADRETRYLASYLLELCHTEYVMLKFAPSMLAASALYTAHFLNRSTTWNTTLQRHSGYNEEQLKESSNLMISFYRQAETAGSRVGSLRAVYDKYHQVN